MGQLSGGAAFAVGHTIESHTKGIWICGAPVQAVTDDGETIDVLFMDSEGLGATDKVSTRYIDVGFLPLRLRTRRTGVTQTK